MDGHAKKFLDGWVEKKVTPAPYQQQKRLSAELTSICLSDAMKVGITRREMEQASGGHLEAFLENAIEDKQDIEVRKNRPAT